MTVFEQLEAAIASDNLGIVIWRLPDGRYTCSVARQGHWTRAVGQSLSEAVAGLLGHLEAPGRDSGDGV